MEKEKQEELKPCPFCGSKALLFNHDSGYCVVCQQPDAECNARIPYCDDEEQAIVQWNRRTAGA